MKIKALSLWQPWASLIAVGAKKYETRSWKTDYRGPLLICASKKPLSLQELRWLDFETKYAIRNALYKQLYYPRDVIDFASKVQTFLPYGNGIAIAELTDCEITNHVKVTSNLYGNEREFGDFSPGRYAWKLENVRAIKPFPVKGRQGLFTLEVPKELLTPPPPRPGMEG